MLDNGATASKTGKACSHQILGIIAHGDTSVETAMANAGISKLVYVSHSYIRIFCLFTQNYVPLPEVIKPSFSGNLTRVLL